MVKNIWRRRESTLFTSFRLALPSQQSCKLITRNGLTTLSAKARARITHVRRSSLAPSHCLHDMRACDRSVPASLLWGFILSHVDELEIGLRLKGISRSTGGR